MRGGATVLLSEDSSGAALARETSLRDGPVVARRSLKELLRDVPLARISVMLFHFPRPPKGVLLASIACLALESPGLQMAAIVEVPLSLPVVEFLTACGVDLIPVEPDGPDPDRVADAVRRLRVRQAWSIAAMAG